MGGKKTVEKNREWEKGRRDKLNQSFCELSKLLPDHDPSITLSKMEILNRAAMYIKTLQRQNQDILNDGKQTYLDEEVDRLQKRVAHLVFKTKLLVDALRNAGVPIPEVKPPKTRNRKKPDNKPSPCLSRESNHSTVIDEKSRMLEEPTASGEVVILTDEALKDVMKTSSSCTSNSLKALEDTLKLTEATSIIPESPSKSKDLIKTSKEPLKEINSTLPSVNIPKDIASISQAPQNPSISVEVKEQPIIAGSLPGVITSLGQGQSSGVTNFTFLERSLVNLGPGTLILADGRVVNVPPPIPQIVVKPQPTLILMQKSVRREKRLYPKPKQVDVTRTTFANKAPIPTIKHFNFEFKTKRSRIKVTKTRLSPKVKKKEAAKSKVLAKPVVTKVDGEVQVEINKTSVNSSISGCSMEYDESCQVDPNQDKISDNTAPSDINLCSAQEKEKEILQPDEDKIKPNSINISEGGSGELTVVDQPVRNSHNGGTMELTSINNNSEEKSINNDFVTSQIKDLEVSVPFEDTDKTTKNHVDTDKECPIIENVEVNPFTPVNSVNSMSVVGDTCIHPNRPFECQMNIDSGDTLKNKDLNKPSLETPVVTHSNTTANNNDINSTNQSNRSVQSFENSSVGLEVDQNQLSKNKTLQVQNIESTQNSTACLAPVGNTAALKEPLNSFKTPQMDHCPESSSIHNRSNKSTSSFPTNLDNSFSNTVYSESNKQYQQISTGTHKSIQNKVNQNSNDKQLEAQTPCKELQSKSILHSEGNNYYNSNVCNKPDKPFYGPQERGEERCLINNYGNQHNSNINKVPYNPDKNHNMNTIQVEQFNQQTMVSSKDNFNKDKRQFEGSNQNMGKDAYVLSHNVPTSIQNINRQPFVDVNKQSYVSQSCTIPRTVAYPDNCDLLKQPFNVNEKSPNKETFGSYISNTVDKSSYLEHANPLASKDSYGNQYNSMKHYFNQGGSINHQSLYMNQYNSSSYSFMSNTSGVYGKESFMNPCESFNFTNPENSNKDYSRRNVQPHKEIYPNNQNTTLNKTGYSNQNSSMNKTTYQNQTSLISKEHCPNNKDTYREQPMTLGNQCNVLNNDTYGSNKDCYAAPNKESYSNQTHCNSLNKESYNHTQEKNVDNHQTLTIKDTASNTNSTPRSTMNKTPFVSSQKNLTADKACQPEMPLCRNITNSEFMEVVNQNALRRNQKESEDIQQLRSGENGRAIDTMRNPRRTANNSVYGTNQPIYTFSSMPEQSLPFDGNVPKRGKETIYTNKNSGNIVCKYTIDSLFKNGDINGAPVNITTERDKVADNGASCKTHVHKKSSGPYEIDGLPIVNENNLNQNQIYQNDSNHFTIANRESQNICDNNTRNNIDLANNGCSIQQQTDVHNNSSCKNSTSNTDKSGQSSNKMFNNDGSFNKSDNILMSPADLMKAKDLDRNNYMPLLDDVRLTTDFSNDLFSSFQVAPGGQHPESMSPTAAFLLAFPLVSTSKAADSINENDNPEHNSSTPTTILQIGNIEQPNSDIFNPQVDNLRTKPVDDANKDFERYSNFDGSVYENVQIESSKRKTSTHFGEQSNNCAEKTFRRTNEAKKRSRNQSEMSSYTQAYSYPIFPGNNDFSQYTNPTTDPKADGVSVPWSMNLNQDFPTQAIQKDACTSTNKPVKNTEKKMSKSDKQAQKSSNYSCSQQGSQTVEYYVSKPERKKQKTSNTKAPVNWMAPMEPSKNTFPEPPLPQIDVYQNNKEHENNLGNNQTQNIYNNIVSSLEVPFDSVCFSDFGNKKSNNYSWSPSKSLLPSLDNHNFVIPSTLPTLVGDLALGTSTPAETFKCFEDNRKFEQPKKADKGSSTFLDNAGITQSSTSNASNKKRVDYSSKVQANNNSFLSVSQLVDPKSQKQNKMNEIKNAKRNESSSTKDKFQPCQNIGNRREQQEQNCIYNHRNEIPNSCWNDKQQKNPYKGNYSAESLIAAQPTSETPESFHLNFNNYQAQGNYFHGDFGEGNQIQQGQQYQNYFNQGATHFPPFLGEEYNQEFSSGSQRKKKNSKETSLVYSSGVQPKDSFTPLHKDNSGYLNTLQKDTGNYQAAGPLSQGYRNCIKIGVPHAGQNSNTTSTLTNFNLSTIFPEMNDQRISGSSQPPHINPNFSTLPLHSYPPH